MSSASDGRGFHIELSIVMPAYRSAATIVGDVRRLLDVLDELDPAHEVIVVVDGDDDDTRERLSALGVDRVTTWYYPRNQGKGFAVTTGLLRARGRLVGFMDSGGDIDVTVWKRMVEVMRSGTADIAVASKVHPDSRVGYPWIRRVYSRAFRMLTRVLFRFDVGDTQTGAKLFTAEVVNEVAPCLLVKRFAFDVEFLALARRRGFSRVVEVPVHIAHDFDSTINIAAVLRMAWDTAAVWYRMYLRHYYDSLDSQQERERMLLHAPGGRVERLGD